jgi:hypothetical protein
MEASPGSWGPFAELRVGGVRELTQIRPGEEEYA